MSLTPAQRSTRARLAAHTRWANTADRTAATQAARDGYVARWERDVDPDGVLPADERAKRGRSAMRAHLSRAALRSSQSRVNCPAPPPPPPTPKPPKG